VKRLTIPLFVKAAGNRIEGWWFDTTRHVHTSGYVFLKGLTLAGRRQSAEDYDYLPIRPSVARQVLTRLPMRNPSEYVFVDFGSGKGRMLLIAAEYPFCKIQGVELALELHRDAEQNIFCYRHARQRSRQLESINVDASEYRFPDRNLVLCFHNPFGPEILRKVFANLGESIAQHPRHIIAVMIKTDSTFVVDSMPFFSLYFETGRFRIYQTANG
jgi:hypothetical protein